MRVPIPNSEEYLLLRELTHRMNNEFTSAAYCRRWLSLASILRRRAIASFATYFAIGARPRQARQYCQSIRVRVPSPSWSVTVTLMKVGVRNVCCRSSCLMAPVQAGESDDKICTVRSAGGEAGQGEGGRGFFTFRRTLGER